MRKMISIYKKDELIAGEVRLADTFFSRMFGLMPTKNLEENKGLLLKPCKQVHTFRMKYAIDVIFLDKENVVVHIEHNLVPNKVTKYYREAYSILELKSGAAAKKQVAAGDQIFIKGA